MTQLLGFSEHRSAPYSSYVLEPAGVMNYKGRSTMRMMEPVN
jgi:hypothetical protein